MVKYISINHNTEQKDEDTCMAIKRDVAEKLMSEKGNLIGSSFSVIPDGFLGLVDDSNGRYLAVVCGEKSEWN